MKAQGTVFKYPDNVDTDVIIPARYLNITNAEELAAHCMEDIDASFVSRVRPGDIMVGGWNFGCGSSREHAPLVIKTCGTGCVIAKSFARIFYRNAINIGLPILECETAGAAIAAGDFFMTLLRLPPGNHSISRSGSFHIAQSRTLSLYLRDISSTQRSHATRAVSDVGNDPPR